MGERNMFARILCDLILSAGSSSYARVNRQGEWHRLTLSSGTASAEKEGEKCRHPLYPNGPDCRAIITIDVSRATQCHDQGGPLWAKQGPAKRGERKREGTGFALHHPKGISDSEYPLRRVSRG